MASPLLPLLCCSLLSASVEGLLQQSYFSVLSASVLSAGVEGLLQQSLFSVLRLSQRAVAASQGRLLVGLQGTTGGLLECARGCQADTDCQAFKYDPQSQVGLM